MMKVCLLVVCILIVWSVPAWAGSFYNNITVVGLSHEKAIQCFTDQEMHGYVSDTIDGKTVLYARELELDPEYLGALAKELSTKWQCVIVSASVFDSDVLSLEVYSAGKQMFYYNSCPGYFDEGDTTPIFHGIENLSKTLGVQFDEEALTTILICPWDDDKYVFVEDRHADIVETLQLPPYSAYFDVDALIDTLKDDKLETYNVHFTKINLR